MAQFGEEYSSKLTHWLLIGLKRFTNKLTHMVAGKCISLPGLPNKVPLTEWLNVFYFLTILGDRCSWSRGWQGCFLLRAIREASVSGVSSWLTDAPLFPVSLHQHQVSVHACVQISSSYKTSVKLD